MQPARDAGNRDQIQEGSRPESFTDSAERLLAQCLGLPEAEQGEALESVCRARPDLAEALRASFGALRALGFAGGEAAPLWPERLGDFRIVEPIGGGGMGVVFRAQQLSLGREVALKLLRPEQQHFTLARERFRREAEAIAALDHPHIVPILAVGEERGVPWFAMPLLRGLTLAEVLSALAARAPESLEGSDLARVLGVQPDSAAVFGRSWTDACVELARQVAQALAHAHERGIRHRDVKPSNIVLGTDGRARLVDFGLAARDELDGLTRTGSQLGTLYYMAPEQLRGERSVGVPADVYGLGVTLHECLALAPPFAGDARREIEDRILRGERQALRSRNRRVGVDLERVVARATDLDPARRYPSAEALADELKRVLERRPVTARPPGALLRARRWTQRHPTRAVTLLAAVGLFVVAPSLLLWREARLGRVLAAALAGEESTSAELRTALGREQQALAELAASLENERAARAAEQAAQEEVRLTAQFLERIFDQANPALARGRELRLIDVLESTASELRAFAGSPRVAARLLETIAKTQGAFDESEAALRNARHALALEEAEGQALGKHPGELRHGYALALSNAGRLQEAEEEARLAIEEHDARHGSDTTCRHRAASRATLGVALLRQHRHAEAAIELRAAFEEHARLLPSDPSGWAVAGVFLADALRSLAVTQPGRESSRAWREHVQALEERSREVLSPQDPFRFQVAHQAARLLSAMDRHQEAFERIEQARQGAEQVFGPSSHWVAFYDEELGGMAFRARDWERAEAALLRALAHQRRVHGEASAQAARTEALLTDLERRRGEGR